MSIRIYIAGPLFSISERAFLLECVEKLAEATGLDPTNNFFLPHRDGGDLGVAGGRNDMFSKDIKELNCADIIVALLDGPDVDSGTAVELGCAYVKGKKIFGLLTDFRAYSEGKKTPSRLNNMVWGVCEQGKTIFRNVDGLARALKKHLQETKL